jgi:uncharacterized membrane protein YhdT
MQIIFLYLVKVAKWGLCMHHIKIIGFVVMAFLVGSDKKGYTELVGAQPFSTFQQELDSELSN